MAFSFVQRIVRLESAGGILLFVAAIAALSLSNLGIGESWFKGPVLFAINDGLMSLFFLFVGLELKREFREGQLAHYSKILLPLIAAVGGMMVPAAIYLLVNHGQPGTASGWAIPVATDIAFALGALSLFGKRVPLSLKLFLMALAIFDDLGAILIIAFFFTHDLAYVPILFAVLIVFFLQVLNYYRVLSLVPYLVLGAFLWFCILKSGIHPTVAGVLLALCIPLGKPLKTLEHALHPWVAFGIMPLFALANAGVSLKTVAVSYVASGVIFGLFIGKQIGVLGFSWMAVRLKWARLPDGASWVQMYGVASLCGIGFTMSLFLGTLAFSRADFYLEEVKVGVLIGSLLSGMLGAGVLYFASKKTKNNVLTKS